MSMARYIGTKVIHAEPQVRGVAAGYRVRYGDGYVSWSPAEAFEEAYRPDNAITFGQALEAMRLGYRVARATWKGHLELSIVSGGEREPYLLLMDSDGVALNGWEPGIADVFAEDWFIATN